MKIKMDPRIVSVEITQDEMIQVVLADGRRMAVPLEWSPRLLRATEAERAVVEIRHNGEAVRWPLADEDLDVSTFFSKEELFVPGDGNLFEEIWGYFHDEPQPPP